MGLGPRGWLLAWGLNTGALLQMAPPKHQLSLEPEAVSVSVGTNGLLGPSQRLIHASVEQHTESMEVSIEDDGMVHGARMEPDKQKPKARETVGTVDADGGLSPQGVEEVPVHAPVGRAEQDAHEAPAARAEALVDVTLAKQWQQAGRHRHELALQVKQQAEADAVASVKHTHVQGATSKSQMIARTLTKVTLAVSMGGGILGFGVLIDYVCFGTCALGILYYLFQKYCDADKSTYIFNCRCWRRMREKIGADHFKTFTLAVAVHRLEDMRETGVKYLVVPLSRPVGKGKNKPSSELLKKAQKTCEGTAWTHETVQVVCEQGKEDLQLAVYKAKALGREEYIGSVELSVMEDVLGPMESDTWSVSTKKSYTVLNPKATKVGKLSVSFYKPPPAAENEDHPVVKAGFRPNLSITFLRAVEDAIEHLNHANIDQKHQVPVNKLHVLSTLLSCDFNLDIGGHDDFRAFEVLRKKKSKKWFWVWYKSTTSRDVAGQLPIAAITAISAVPSNREALAIAYQGKGHTRQELYLGTNPQAFVKGREEVIQALRMLLSAVAEDEGREGPVEEEAAVGGADD